MIRLTSISQLQSLKPGVQLQYQIDGTYFNVQILSLRWNNSSEVEFIARRLDLDLDQSYRLMFDFSKFQLSGLVNGLLTQNIQIWIATA